MAYGDRPGGAKPRRTKPRRPAPRPAPTPQTQIGAIPSLGAFPGQQQAQKAQRKVDRATPKRPAPHVPVIRNPSRQQTQAAKALIQREVNRRVGSSGTGAQRLARRRRVLAQIQADPSQRRLQQAIQHYVQADERQTAEMIGRALIGRQQSRAARIRAGRQAIAYQRQRDTVRPGRAPTVTRLGIGPAAVNIAPLARSVRGGLAAATTLDVGDIGPRTAFGRVAGDVGTLVTGPVVGGWEIGQGLLEAAKDIPAVDAALRALPSVGPLANLKALVPEGRGTGRLQRVGEGVAEGYWDSSPGHLARAGGNLAAGDTRGASRNLSAAGEAFAQHPLLEALNFAGTASVAGRAAGAGARLVGSAERGGVRGALGRAGSTVRPPIALSNEASVPPVQRNYSRDSIRKAGQVLSDSRRQPLRREDGSVVTVRDRGREVPVLQAHPWERSQAKREANFRAFTTNSRERVAREEATSAPARMTRVKGKVARDLVQMVVEGTVTSAQHFRRDLVTRREHLKRLIAQHEEAIRTGDDAKRVYTLDRDLENAKRSVAQIDKALASPKVMAQAERIIQAGEERGRWLNEGDARNANREILDPKAARRRALLPTAVGQMGGRHFTVEEHARLEADARKVEDAARERLAAADTPAAKAAARKDLKAAREHRIAVSGRDPRKVVAHERARAVHGNATRRHKQAQAKVARLEASRQRLLGAQASRRGRRQADALKGDLKSRSGERPMGRATEAEKRKLAKIERLLTQARAEEKATRTARAKAKESAGKTPLPDANAGIRYGEGSGKTPGSFLPNAHIEEFLRSRGRDPETIAYVPHNDPGNRAYHTQFRPGSRPNLDSGPSFTGEAFRKGSVGPSSARILQDAGVRQATQLVKAEELDALVGELGMKHPVWEKAQRGETLTKADERRMRRGGGFYPKEAEELKRRLEDRGELYDVIRAFPAKLDAETQRIISEDLQGPGAMDSLSQRMLDARIVTDDALRAMVGRKGTPNLYLIKREVTDRLNRHLAPAGELEKLAQMMNKPFRMSVLPQPRWLTGNFVEPYIVRLTANGSGLNVFGLAHDIATYRTFLREMERSGDPAMRARGKMLREVGEGGLFIGNRGASVRRSLEEIFPPNTKLGRTYGRMVARLPVVGQMAEMVRGLGHLLAKPLEAFFTVNRQYIERYAQQASLGRQMRRDLQEFQQSWVKSVRLSSKAIQELLDTGYASRQTWRRLVEGQREMLGQYDGFSPKTRRLVQTIAPFLPWALNAARFVFWTMPAHHSALTSLLIQTNNVVAKDWAEEHKDLPPGSLRYAVRRADGGLTDVARYTPWGLTTPTVGQLQGGSSRGALQVVTDQFMPQFSGAFNAVAFGVDPFGRPLKVRPTTDNPKGEPNLAQTLGIAGNSLLEAGVPYLGQGRRLLEGGATAYADSNLLSPKVKEGSDYGMSPFERVFDPFRPTYVKPPTTAAKGGKGPRLDPVDAADLDDAIREATRGGGAALDAADMQDLQDAIDEALGARP